MAIDPVALMRLAILEAAPAIEIIARGGVMEHFSKSESPEGVSWAPLKVRTGKPLMDTGILRASVKARMQDHTLAFSANSPGARVHQFGATIRPVNKRYLAFPVGTGRGRRIVLAKQVTIPARPYLGLSLKTTNRITGVIADKAAKVLSKLMEQASAGP